MGTYTEYLDRSMSMDEMTAERKVQLERISALREGTDVLVYASDLDAAKAPTSMDYSDLLPLNDQLSNLKGSQLDLILETPGGAGEVAEDFVCRIREQYERVAVIIPGWAKSAGTIVAMGADEILMGPTSALGPIDAQMRWQGKAFSAGAFLDGMEKIKEEVEATGRLNRAYIPILQGISPGEIQHAENAQDFAKGLVTDWLANIKFRDWKTHSSDGRPVTEAEREERAQEIADKLSAHDHWKTHGRSIRIDDLREMKLLVTDYTDNPELADAIGRYHTLLQMSFDTSIYKLFETPGSQIYRIQSVNVPSAANLKGAEKACVDVVCKKCGTKVGLQANLQPDVALEGGRIAFPPSNKIKCPDCGTELDVAALRRKIEMLAKRKVLS
jgi:ClpP class serine protease